MACPFCDKKIIQKQRYFESEYFWVLVDSRPITYAHSLIVPKRHVEHFNKLNKEEIIDLFSVINILIEKLLSKFKCDGFNLISNNGASAGQTVDRAHLHFIPRKKGDRKGDFKNLCFPTEKERINLTNKQFKERTRELSKVLAH